MLSGEQVGQLRKAKGLTLMDLAKKSGVHYLLLARYEKGQVKRMSDTHQAALQEALQSRVDDNAQTFNSSNAPAFSPFDHTLPLALPFHPSGFPIRASHSLDECSATLADWICALDPTWANRLQIMKDERGFSTTQALSTCIAYVLEHDLHMVILKHDALEPSPWRRGEKMECPECHALYTPNYPGQPYCGNSCADQYREQHQLDMEPEDAQGLGES